MGAALSARRGRASLEFGDDVHGVHRMAQRIAIDMSPFDQCDAPTQSLGRARTVGRLFPHRLRFRRAAIAFRAGAIIGSVSGTFSTHNAKPSLVV